jgi:gliding motility-associated-like protein
MSINLKKEMMKTKLHNVVIAFALFLLPNIIFGQAPIPPSLGKAATFAMFTKSGSISNSGSLTKTKITGNVGSAGGGLTTGFGNIDGQMLDGKPLSAMAAADLQIAYDSLAHGWATTAHPLYVLGLPGAGETLSPGVYAFPAPFTSTLSGKLILDGLGNPNAVFIFQMGAAFSSTALSNISLINGAKACNVFWRINGGVGLATGTQFKGNLLCNGAIDITVDDNIEGRVLSIVGALTITGAKVATPIGCGSPFLTGPLLPNIYTLECYALYTSLGALTNSGVSHIIGDIGTNSDPTNPPPGFTPAMITGTIQIMNPSTIQAKKDADSLNVHLDSLSKTKYDIELLHPNLLGNSLVLTPHVYSMKAAASLTDTLFLDAENNPDAVFVIRVEGALTTNSYSKIELLRGAKSSNVFWKVSGGLVHISDHSTFRGTVLTDAGAVNLDITDSLYGRLISVNGAITTDAIEMAVTSAPTNVTPSGATSFCQGDSVILTASLSSSYLWSTGATTQSITVKVSGTYSVTAKNTCGISNTSSATTVTVKSAPAANVGVDKSICIGSSTSIGAAAIVGHTYSWTPITKLNSSTSSQPTASPTNTTTYTLTETDTTTKCSNSNSVKVTVNTLPAANVGSAKTICSGSSTSIGAVAIVGHTYSWTPTTALNSSTSSQPTASPTNTTTYTLTETDTTAKCSNSDSVIVTVNILPAANAGSAKSICSGSSTSIGAAAIAGNTYSWTPTTALNSSTLSQPTANPTNTTTYTLTETVVVTGCSKSNSVVVTVNPLPAANAGLDQTIVSGKSADIGAAAVFGNTYSWTPATGLSSTTVSNPKASPTVNTTYTLIETITLTGCSNTNAVVIIVQPMLDFFNGFSPNGDGYNDYWNIPVLNYNPSNTVSILNRWGGVVWTGTNYDNKTVLWTGKNMNSDDLPDGTYYYIINYSDIVKRGWVFIKR